MKKRLLCLKKLRFLLAVAALFAVADFLMSSWAPVERSTLFIKNDYEKTVLAHGGGMAYDKVFYGNSVLISSFIEEESDAGYVNFGMDYATAADLRDLLQKGMLKVEGSLVLSLNYFVLLDTLDTNETYPWHRKALEPYFYFQRDRLRKFITTGMLKLMAGEPLPRYPELQKAVYYGMMTDEALDEKIRTHNELFWGLDISCYQKNLAALEEVIAFCAENGIRLRAVWMPWNDYIGMPENPNRVREAADMILQAGEIEVLDLTDAFPRECFHDLGHLNYEYGARIFTKEIDKWLSS